MSWQLWALRKKIVHPLYFVTNAMSPNFDNCPGTGGGWLRLVNRKIVFNYDGWSVVRCLKKDLTCAKWLHNLDRYHTEDVVAGWKLTRRCFFRNVIWLINKSVSSRQSDIVKFWQVGHWENSFKKVCKSVRFRIPWHCINISVQNLKYVFIRYCLRILVLCSFQCSPWGQCQRV